MAKPTWESFFKSKTVLTDVSSKVSPKRLLGKIRLSTKAAG